MERLSTYTRRKFLSTLSLRRATPRACPAWSPRPYFYPRSPCGERQYWVGGYGTANNFYPRSPCGERRVKSFMRNGFFLISIHALLAESDNVACGDRHQLCDFYPRSPCGERLPCCGRGPVERRISIHALLAESDVSTRIDTDNNFDFYPRSPCGERPAVGR